MSPLPRARQATLRQTFLFSLFSRTTPLRTNLALTLLPVVLYVIIYFAIAGLITKAVLDCMTIGDHALRCGWNIVALVFIQITNLLAIVSSAGLLIPWATIRVQRYRIEHLALEVHGDLESIGARVGEEVSAIGEEIGDAFDFDFGI